METLLQADIFFFIASLATIIVVVLLSIVLVYVIKTGKNIYAISEILKNNLKESGKYIAIFKERVESTMVFRLLFKLFQKIHKTKDKHITNKNKLT